MWIKISNIIFLLFIVSCFPYKNDNFFLRTRLNASKNIEVVAVGFDYNFKTNKKKDINYYIMLKFNNLSEVKNKYLKIEFEEPQKRNSFTFQIVLINGYNKKILLTSEKFSNFKNKETYKIKVSLLNNNKGDKILEEIIQPVKVQYNID